MTAEIRTEMLGLDGMLDDDGPDGDDDDVRLCGQKIWRKVSLFFLRERPLD